MHTYDIYLYACIHVYQLIRAVLYLLGVSAQRHVSTYTPVIYACIHIHQVTPAVLDLLGVKNGRRRCRGFL